MVRDDPRVFHSTIELALGLLVTLAAQTCTHPGGSEQHGPVAFEHSWELPRSDFPLDYRTNKHNWGLKQPGLVFPLGRTPSVLFAWMRNQGLLTVLSIERPPFFWQPFVSQQGVYALRHDRLQHQTSSPCIHGNFAYKALNNNPEAPSCHCLLAPPRRLNVP